MFCLAAARFLEHLKTNREFRGGLAIFSELLIGEGDREALEIALTGFFVEYPLEEPHAVNRTVNAINPTAKDLAGFDDNDMVDLILMKRKTSSLNLEKNRELEIQKKMAAKLIASCEICTIRHTKNSKRKTNSA